MKAFYFIVNSFLLAAVPTMSIGQLPQRILQGPRFFYASKNSALLRAVREGMEKRISFNGHFSQSFVSCGVACGTYFFVDRWNGGVVLVPEGDVPNEQVWDVAAKLNSGVIKVTFGPMDGVDHGCTSQHFRLSEHKFVAVDARAPVRCPK